MRWKEDMCVCVCLADDIRSVVGKRDGPCWTMMLHIIAPSVVVGSFFCFLSFQKCLRNSARNSNYCALHWFAMDPSSKKNVNLIELFNYNNDLQWMIRIQVIANWNSSRVNIEWYRESIKIDVYNDELWNDGIKLELIRNSFSRTSQEP